MDETKIKELIKEAVDEAFKRYEPFFTQRERIDPMMIPMCPRPTSEDQTCLHDGLKPTDVHMIACPCPKCSPRC
jgi:hypothetical protein